MAAGLAAMLAVPGMAVYGEAVTEEAATESTFDLTGGETNDGLTLTWKFNVSSGDIDADEDLSELNDLQLMHKIGEVNGNPVLNYIVNYKDAEVTFLMEADAENQVLRFSIPETGKDTVYELRVADLLQKFAGLFEKSGAQTDEDAVDPAEVLLPYVQTFAEYGAKHTASEEGEIALPLLGETAQGSTLTLSLNGSGLAKLLEDLALQIENDPDLGKLLNSVADQMQSAGELGAEFSVSAKGAGESESSTVAETNEESIAIVRSLAQLLPGILRSGASQVESMGNFDFCTISIGMSESGVVLFDTAVLGGGSVESDSYIGLHYENNGQQVKVKAGSGSESIDLDASYDHSDSGVFSNYTVTSGEKVLAEGNYGFTFDEKSVLGIPYGSAGIDCTDAGLSMGMYVIEASENKEDGDDHTFYVSYIEPEGEGTNDFFFELDLNAKEGVDQLLVPTGTAEDITDYVSEDYEKLFTEIGEALEEKLGEQLS